MRRVAVLLLALTGLSLADPIPRATYVARVLRIVDGDTLEAQVDVWPTITAKVMVRLAGIDTPELHGACATERARAIAARTALAALVADGVVYLREPTADLYRGRIDARVLLGDGRDVGAAMIGTGHARAYDGKEHRAGWCATVVP